MNLGKPILHCMRLFPHVSSNIGLRLASRLCTLLEGEESIRSYIAFLKNNAGRDMMAQSPSVIKQL